MTQDRPTAAQLVTAVREFLERDVMGATDGRVNFHARVAVNVLNTVARELELGEGFREGAVSVSGRRIHGCLTSGGRKAGGMRSRSSTMARRPRLVAAFRDRPRIAPIWAKFRPSK